MSARDAESGSSSYKGGSGSAGGVGNGGLGGGMGAGGNWGMGGSLGGAARNGGYAADRTGMYTGAKMYGNTAFGRPGQAAYGYGTRLTNGMMTDFRMPNGMRPQTGIQQGPLNRPTHQGLLGNPVPAAVAGVNPVPETVPPVMNPNPFTLPPATQYDIYIKQLQREYNKTFASRPDWERAYRAMNEPNMAQYPGANRVTGNWQQPYNPATSPGYDAYTSVYKNGPASPQNNFSNVPQNNEGNFAGYYKR